MNKKIKFYKIIEKNTKNIKIYQEKIYKMPLHYYTQIQIHVFKVRCVLSWGQKVSSTQGWQYFYNTHVFDSGACFVVGGDE
jgi:hypothetical protein